jgi:hypothetical protein
MDRAGPGCACVESCVLRTEGGGMPPGSGVAARAPGWALWRCANEREDGGAWLAEAAGIWLLRVEGGGPNDREAGGAWLGRTLAGG